MAAPSRKWETVNKTGHFSNVFPVFVKTTVRHLPRASQPVSERMEYVSSVLQMLRWNPPRAGGWIPAKANGLSVALLLLCSDVTTGPPSPDNVCFGRRNSAQRSHRWLGNPKSILTWASLGCGCYLLFNMGLEKTCWVTCEFAWHFPHIWLGSSSGGRSALKGRTKKTEHRRRRSGVVKEAEPPQSWSASNIRCSHFSDMCTYCGQHGGPAATWPDDISFFCHGSLPRSLSLSRRSQFFSLLPLFKDVSERWAADSVCRCSSERGWLACPGCTPPPSRMSSGTGSSLPWSKCACQYSQVEEITSIGSSSACFFLLLLNNFEHIKKNKPCMIHHNLVRVSVVQEFL